MTKQRSWCRMGSLAAIAVTAVSLSAVATSARADAIVWGTPTAIAGEGDVSTTGTLVYAYHFAPAESSATTINGVTFALFTLPTIVLDTSAVTVGDVSISESPGYLYGDVSLGTSAPATAFTALSTAYQTMLKNGATSSLPPAITLDLGGLVSGQTYDFQWWSSQSTGYVAFGQTTAAAGNAVTLSSNTLADGENPSGYEGGTGQFAIGRFTATGATYSITFNGESGKWPLINGFQLRSVSAPVPEIDPAGVGSVLALLSGALGILERRRSKAS